MTPGTAEFDLMVHHLSISATDSVVSRMFCQEGGALHMLVHLADLQGFVLEEGIF